jgi:hypothetical protein
MGGRTRSGFIVGVEPGGQAGDEGHLYEEDDGVEEWLEKATADVSPALRGIAVVLMDRRRVAMECQAEGGC